MSGLEGVWQNRIQPIGEHLRAVERQRLRHVELLAEPQDLEQADVVVCVHVADHDCAERGDDGVGLLRAVQADHLRHGALAAVPEHGGLVDVEADEDGGHVPQRVGAGTGGAQHDDLDVVVLFF